MKMSGKRRRQLRKKIAKKERMQKLLQRLKVKEMEERDGKLNCVNPKPLHDSTNSLLKPAIVSRCHSNESCVSLCEDDKNIDPPIQKHKDLSEKRKIDFFSQTREAKRSRLNSNLLTLRNERIWPIKSNTGNLVSWLNEAEQIMESSSCGRYKRMSHSPSPAPKGNKRPQKRAKSALELSCYQPSKFEDSSWDPMDTTTVEEVVPTNKRSRKVVHSLSSSGSSSTYDNSVTHPKKRTKSTSKDEGFIKNCTTSSVNINKFDKTSLSGLGESISLQYEDCESMRHLDASVRSSEGGSYNGKTLSSTEKVMAVVEFEELPTSQAEISSNVYASFSKSNNYYDKMSTLPTDSGIYPSIASTEASKHVGCQVQSLMSSEASSRTSCPVTRPKPAVTLTPSLPLDSVACSNISSLSPKTPSISKSFSRIREW